MCHKKNNHPKVVNLKNIIIKRYNFKPKNQINPNKPFDSSTPDAGLNQCGGEHPPVRRRLRQENTLEVPEKIIRTPRDCDYIINHSPNKNKPQIF